MSESVEDVGDRDDASRDRDLRPREPVGISAAVPLFMVGQSDLLSHHKERISTAGEQRGADGRVRLDLLELVLGQLAGLAQNRVRDRDLAQIMQRRRQTNQLNLAFRQPYIR